MEEQILLLEKKKKKPNWYFTFSFCSWQKKKKHFRSRCHVCACSPFAGFISFYLPTLKYTHTHTHTCIIICMAHEIER